MKNPRIHKRFLLLGIHQDLEEVRKKKRSGLESSEFGFRVSLSRQDRGRLQTVFR